jgi:hypothetical protein
LNIDRAVRVELHDRTVRPRHPPQFTQP